MTRAAPWRIGALTAIVLLVSGCGSPTPPAFTEQTDPQTDEDRIPNGTPDAIDPSSTRFVGSYEGADFYLGVSTQPDMRGGPCIIMHGPKGGSTGCSEHGQFTVNWQGFGSARYLTPATADDKLDEGWIRISDNLVVHPTS